MWILYAGFFFLSLCLLCVILLFCVLFFFVCGGFCEGVFEGEGLGVLLGREGVPFLSVISRCESCEYGIREGT